MKRLTTADVLERMGWKSRETLRQRVKAGLFPPPVRDQGSKINFWFDRDVDEVQTQQVEARDSAAAEQPETQSA